MLNDMIMFSLSGFAPLHEEGDLDKSSNLSLLPSSGMGGHGGLNILPQKSWHVYRRDNVSKVEKDEAEAKAKEDAEKTKHENEEREYRRQLLLLRRGAGRHADSPCEGGATADLTHSPDHALPGPSSTFAVASGPEGGQIMKAPAAEPAAPQHINFWSEDEARMKAEHPDNVAEKKDAALKRGKEEFYTSDAKFDERFKLGYGLVGEQVCVDHVQNMI